jgi:hypothetical protein
LLRIIQSPLDGVDCSQGLLALVSTHSFTEAFVLAASLFGAGFCPGKAAITGNSSAMPAAIDRYIAPPELQLSMA